MGDLPPKPPPRTFGVIDVNKPAYPSDSPKPNLIDKLKFEQPPYQKGNFFEFPDPKPQQQSWYETPINIKPPDSPALHKDTSKFQPKLSSTPKSKESLADNDKISPTNSIVRAMIYSNKNKAVKKKNSITASRYAK